MSLFDGKFCPQDDDNEDDMTETKTVPIEPDLLPCPFCGGDARLISDGGSGIGSTVACNHCHICGHDYDKSNSSGLDFDTAAVKAWNTRAAPPDNTVQELRGQVAELVKALEDADELIGIEPYEHVAQEAADAHRNIRELVAKAKEQK